MSETYVSHTKPWSRIQSLSESRGGSKVTKPIFSNSIKRYCAYVIVDLSWWRIQYPKNPCVVFATQKNPGVFHRPQKIPFGQKWSQTPKNPSDPPSLKYVSGAPGSFSQYSKFTGGWAAISRKVGLSGESVWKSSKLSQDGNPVHFV